MGRMWTRTLLGLGLITTLGLGCGGDDRDPMMAMDLDGGGITLADGGTPTPTPNPNPNPNPTPSGCAEPSAPLGTFLGDGAQVSTNGTLSGESARAPMMCRQGGQGGEAIFTWTAPRAGSFEISTNGSSFDTMLYVLSDGTEIACNDDISNSNRSSTLQLTLDACQTLDIVVDGYNPSDSGAFNLTVRGIETACDDELDGDGDGLVDCDDPDCPSSLCVDTSDWPAEWQTFEEQMLVEVNRYRAMGATCDTDVFGPAVALEMNPVIRIAARKHSQDMGVQNYFEHDSLDGREFGDRMQDEGFAGAYPWAENIAAGQPTAADATLGLMNSPGHCRNIMNPELRTIGIGYAYVEGSRYGHYWTQDFAAGH